MNKNKDEFNGIGVGIVKSGEMVVGKIEHLDVPRDRTMKRVYELNYGGGVVGGRAKGTFGPSPLRSILKDLIALDMLKKAQAQIFFNRYESIMTEEERRYFMEKYGVEVDPKKVDDAKKKVPGEKTAGVDDPNVNVPKDPDKGTEPFEKNPEGD